VSRSALLAPLLDPDAHPVVGHRGASGHAPENTLPSFELAAASGADALEFDVHLTADGVAVVIHDPTLDRTTDRSGAVAALRYAEIREADAGARFTTDGGRTNPFRGRAAFVPTLEQVVNAFPELPLVIEIKTARAQDEAFRVLDRCGCRTRAIVSSFDPLAVTRFREAGWATGAASNEAARLKFALRDPAAVPFAALFVPVKWRGIPVPTRGFVRRARRLGLPVHVWTVNDPVLGVTLWKRGCAGMIGNFPLEMRKARDGAGIVWRAGNGNRETGNGTANR
jgi:glycerophosphoryl diester phosphodiesterase